MKKTTLVLGGVLALGLVANTFAQTTNVYSRNAVGYINVALVKGFNLISVQLNKSDASGFTIGDILGSQVPDFMTVYAFVPPVGPYLSYSFFSGVWYDDQTGLPGAETNTIAKGSGIWVWVPEDYTNSTYNLSVVGEVPSGATSTVAVANGMTIFSYPFPVSRPFAQTALAANVQDFDVVYVFVGGTWVGYQYFSGSWYDVDSGTPLSPPTLEPGKSYYYAGSQDRTVSETKPYLWP